MRIPQKSSRPWRRVHFTVKAAQFTPVLTNYQFAQSLTQTCSSLQKWTWIQCLLTTMTSLFKLKKLPIGCTLLHLKLNEASFKKYLNQSLKKLELEKKICICHFLSWMQKTYLTLYCFFLFLHWFTTNNKQGYYFFHSFNCLHYSWHYYFLSFLLSFCLNYSSSSTN